MERPKGTGLTDLQVKMERITFTTKTPLRNNLNYYERTGQKSPAGGRDGERFPNQHPPSFFSQEKEKYNLRGS